jgi:ABC-type transport system substrate-binding protein
MGGIIMKKLLISFLSILSISFFSTVLFAKDSMVVSYKDDVSTLDPAIGYDWQNWSMIKSLFDGLMDYEPGTTNLTPDLAESYSVSDDGMTYTFNLRKGVKFHNGRELTSDDIKYSIERSVNPETQSPGAGFFWSIDGFDSMSSGSANNLSGISTPDKHTVVIKLSQPDATFLHVVAINFSFAVPKEEIEKYETKFHWGHVWGFLIRYISPVAVFLVFCAKFI